MPALTKLPIDPQGIIRVTDTGTNSPKTANGHEDRAETDFLLITANGTARSVTVAATNDDAAQVPLILEAKGSGAVVPKLTTAARDLITPIVGMLIYNTTTNKLNFAKSASVGSASWEAVTSS